MIPSIANTLGELDAGNLDAQASHALREIAQAVRDIDGTRVKGRLKIDLTFERAKGSGQVLVSHQLSYIKPTTTGKLSEETNGDTLMYVGAAGALSVLPETQGRFDFTKEEMA